MNLSKLNIERTASAQRHFLLLLLGYFFAMLVCVLLLTRIVDPYGLWASPRVAHFNYIKPSRESYDYLFKARDIARIQPDTVFIGSSRVAFGLNPQAQALKHKSNDAIYNAGLIGGNLASTRIMIEQSIESDPHLKTIIWGLDFFAFNQQLSDYQSANESRQPSVTLGLNGLVSHLLTRDAARDSYLTIKSNWQGTAIDSYHHNGQLNAQILQENIERHGLYKRFEKSLSAFTNSEPYPRYKGYSFDQSQWQHLVAVKALARKHDIELHIYISPIHASLFEAMFFRQIWPEYIAWLRLLSSEFDYWDYSMPNTVNTEGLTDQAQYYWDVSHFRSAVGDRILEDLNGGPHTDSLGYLVTDANATEYLQKLDKRFTQWREKQHNIRLLVEAVAK